MPFNPLCEEDKQFLLLWRWQAFNCFFDLSERAHTREASRPHGAGKAVSHGMRR